VAKGGFFRRVRVGVLLFVLAVVAADAWLTRLRTTDWDKPLWVTVYPINGDASAAAEGYIHGLSRASFRPIERFMARQARHYGVGLAEPMAVRLGPQIPEPPPASPGNGNPLAVGWWSLKMRYWAYRASHDAGGPPYDIRLFAIYFDPATHPRLAHSLGLQKGLIGVANLYADPAMAGTNRVIMAHELLHTVGATDKYDLSTNRPLYPAGYAEPARSPRFPQRKAEIMAGRIPLSPTRAAVPRSLAFTVIGPRTAREINW